MLDMRDDEHGRHVRMTIKTYLGMIPHFWQTWEFLCCLRRTCKQHKFSKKTILYGTRGTIIDSTF